MSRLTHSGTGEAIPSATIKQVCLKLRDYEDIGELEELVKPVRCGECRYLRECGRCINSQWNFDQSMAFMKPNNYCSYGELKERSETNE